MAFTLRGLVLRGLVATAASLGTAAGVMAEITADDYARAGTLGASV